MPYAPQRLPYPDNVTVRTVKNSEPATFRIALIAFPDGTHEVEQIADGQTICVKKPGGKVGDIAQFDYDFEVFLCDAVKTEAWRISHKAIKNDLVKKLKANPTEGRKIIAALESVYEGEEPSAIMAASPTLGQGLAGLPAEAILKLYKWIWGQEDCNFPPPRYEGRNMSMSSILEL